jgi:hypothetical protein
MPVAWNVKTTRARERERDRDNASRTSPSVHKHDDGERKTEYDAPGDGRRRVQHCCSHGRTSENPDWMGSALHAVPVRCTASINRGTAQRPGSSGAWAWAWSGVTHVSSAGAVSLRRSRDHGAGRWRWCLFLLLLLSQCLHSQCRRHPVVENQKRKRRGEGIDEPFSSSSHAGVTVVGRISRRGRTTAGCPIMERRFWLPRDERTP